MAYFKKCVIALMFLSLPIAAQAPAPKTPAPQADGTTPLEWAINRDDAAIVAALVQAGASVNAADENGETALTLACAAGNLNLARLLQPCAQGARATNAHVPKSRAHHGTQACCTARPVAPSHASPRSLRHSSTASARLWKR